MTPTRRIVLGGGLAAAVWRLSGSGASGRRRSAAQGILNFEAAPARLQLAPAPAEPAAAYAYAGAIPGPLIRLRQGEELRLRFANKLAEPTTLSFPGLRAANAAAGIGGLTQERLKPGASAEIRFVPPDSGFNLYLPHAGSTDASQQGRGLFGPIIVDEPKAPDVDLDAAVMLSDWNVDASGQIKDDFADPAIGRGSGRKGGVVFANGAAAPLKLKRPTGARVQAASRQRRDRASGDRRDKRRKDPHRGRRRPAERAIRTAQQPVSDGSWRPVRTDVRYAARPRRRRPSRPARRRWRGRPTVHCDRVRGRTGGRRAPNRRGSPPIRGCRRKSPSNPRGVAILPSAAAAQRRLRSTAQPSSTGRQSPHT